MTMVASQMKRPTREEMQAALAKVRALKRFAEEFLEDVRSSEGGVSERGFNTENVKRLADVYKEIRIWISMHFYEIGVQMPHVDASIFYNPGGGLKWSLDEKEVEIVLRDIIIGCDAAEQGLQALLEPLVEPNILNRLDSLKRELEKLENEGLDASVVKNLREAIAEAEQGHYLASAMISSRVIRYVVDRIPGDMDEDKVKCLVETGVVPRDRKDVQKQVITSMRLSRNFLSHRVDLFPDPGETLMLLGGALALAKLALSAKLQT